MRVTEYLLLLLLIGTLGFAYYLRTNEVTYKTKLSAKDSIIVELEIKNNLYSQEIDNLYKDYKENGLKGVQDNIESLRSKLKHYDSLSKDIVSNVDSQTFNNILKESLHDVKMD